MSNQSFFLVIFKSSSINFFRRKEIEIRKIEMLFTPFLFGYERFKIQFWSGRRSLESGMNILCSELLDGAAQV